MNHSKLETMSKWLMAIQKKKLQLFLGFANYYCQFIINYSANAYPLID